MQRRSLLQTGLLLPLGARVVSAAPAAEPVTPALVEAAKKEGKVTYYTAMERSGAERVFNRIGQEMASKIYRVDVVNGSDAAHFISWKREGWLAPYVSEEMARDLPAEMLDADGLYCTQR